MIDLTSLKEQLQLLGHSLPDDQIINILGELHIDFQPDAADTIGSHDNEFVSFEQLQASGQKKSTGSYYDYQDEEEERRPSPIFEKVIPRNSRTEEFDSTYERNTYESNTRKTCKKPKAGMHIPDISDDVEPSSFWEEEDNYEDHRYVPDIEKPKKSALKKQTPEDLNQSRPATSSSTYREKPATRLHSAPITRERSAPSAGILYDDYEQFRTCKSTASISSSVSGLPRPAPGAAPKVDRVSRYRQLQQSWSKDKFLAAAGERKASARKPVNFHQHFRSLHTSEEDQRRRMLKETRSRTQADLAVGREFVAPNTKPRDDVRWDTRQRLRNLS